jgi:hypothetical protein
MTSLHVLCHAVIPAHAIIGLHGHETSTMICQHPLLVFLICKFWILILVWVIIPLDIFFLLFLFTPDGRWVPMYGEGRLKYNASRLARARACGYSRNGRGRVLPGARGNKVVS